MRKLGVLALGIIVLALAGCSTLSSGIITNKAYSPGYWYTTTTCQLVGKNTVCTPHQAYWPPSHRFDLRDGDKEGFIYVDEFTYHEYEVGDYYG